MGQGHENSGYDLGTGLKAAGDLRAEQYKVVDITSGEITVVGAATDTYVGVLQNAPNTGEPCTVKATGITKAIAGSVLATVGTRLMCDSTGRVVAHTTTNCQIGILLSTAAAANDVVTIDIIRQYKAP